MGEACESVPASAAVPASTPPGSNWADQQESMQEKKRRAATLARQDVSIGEAVPASAAVPASTPPGSNWADQKELMQEKKRLSATLAVGDTFDFLLIPIIL